MSSVKLIPRNEIDDKLWNGCVHFAINAMPYGYTWFLDNICENWDGLVMGDYRAVMPLVYDKKLGQSYIYQPYLARQLGLFSLRMPDKKMLGAFMEAIPQQYVDVQMSFSDFGTLSYEGFDFKKDQHYILNLPQTYPDFEASRSAELSKIITENTEAQYIKSDIKPEQVVDLFKEHLSCQKNKLRDVDYHALHRIIYKAQFYSVGQSLGLYKNDLLVASLFYIYSRHSILIYLAASSVTTPNGIAILINHLVLTNSGSRKVLDFGQFLEELGQTHLPALFNASPFNYWQMTQKKVPWYLKYIK